MTLRSTLWGVAAALFFLINLGGAGIAVARGELLHAGVHLALLLLGSYAVCRLAPRMRRQNLPGSQQSEDRLDYLQQSVDAVALEVERIGEAQRFDAKLREHQAATLR